MPGDWLLWQLVDSAFPTGGFAHSAGVEAAWHHGAVADEASLRPFAQLSLEQAGATTLPLLTAVHRDPLAFAEIDSLTDALLSNHVANRASAKQGRALLSSAATTFDCPALNRLKASVYADKSPGHLAPVFGAVTRALDVPLDAARHLHLYATLRGVTSAAVRLGIIGPLQAQRLQHELEPFARDAAERSSRLSLDDLAQPAPFLDMLQATQDRLYSRLFQS